MADKSLTLREFIDQKYEENEHFDGQIVKIGSASAFFYYGTMGKFMDNVGTYDEKIRKCFDQLVIRTDASLKKAINNPPTISQYAEELIKKDEPEFNMAGYEKSLKRWYRMLLRKKLSKEEAVRKAKRTKKLMDRKVIDSYPASDGIDENTLIIILEGFEQGRIWIGSEAKTLGCFAFNGNSDEEEE